MKIICRMFGHRLVNYLSMDRVKVDPSGYGTRYEALLPCRRCPYMHKLRFTITPQH